MPPWVDQIVSVADGSSKRARASAIPLDIRGTAFQQRVWREIPRLPAGETCSYTDLARALGAASSARAVAGACAANRIALLIPCHCVVTTTGRSTGYRWGIPRKQHLLHREAQATGRQQR